MKIIYFFTETGMTGGTISLYNFMNGLVERGHEVYIVSMYGNVKWEKDIYKTWPRTRHLRQKLILHPQRKVIQFFTGSKARGIFSIITRELLKNFRALGVAPDVIIATHTSTAEAAFLVGKGVRLVMHDQHFEELMYHGNDVAAVRALNYLPFFHIVNCGWLQKMVHHGYHIDAPILNPGLDQTIFNYPIDEKKFTHPEKVRLITYCDPTRAFKAAPQQIAILAALHRAYPEVEILIFGKDPKTSAFPYRFLGWISQKDLAREYSLSHLHVTFSWYESFPAPPMEAMGCGCAVASTRYGTEDILEDGVSGRVIDVFNTDGAVKILSGMVANPAALLPFVKEGKRVAANLLWDRQIDKLESILKSVKPYDPIDVERIQQGSHEEMHKAYD